jgi:hypothetical protein
MRINAPAGQKIKYKENLNNPWGGEGAAYHLKDGYVYTVKETHVEKSVTYVNLLEFPEQTFNSVLFEEIQPLLEATNTPEELYLMRRAERAAKKRLMNDRTAG